MTGLVGGIMSSESQSAANARNLSYSKQENEKNRKFSHDERVDQNQWEAQEYYNRMNYANTMYRQNFNDQQQAAYDLWLKENDPNNLLPAYQKAGFNMSALAGDMGSGMISPSSTPVPSAQSPSSGGSTGAPSALPANQVGTGQAAASMISSIGGLIKSLASAGKDNADMQSVLTLLGPQFKNMILQNQGLELMNQYSQIQNKYADAFKSEELRNLTNEADDKLVSAWLKSVQGEFVEEQTVTEKLNQVLKGIDIEIGRTKSEEEKQQLVKLKIEAGLWHQNILSQIKANNAKATESYAKANEAKENANYIKANTNQVEFFNNLRNDPQAKASLLTEMRELGKYAVNKNKLTANQAAEMYHMAEQAAYADDMKKFTYWSDQVQGYLGIAFGAAGAGGNFMKAQQMLTKPVQVTGFK